MNCSILVDRLLENEQLVSFFPLDQTGHPAIYQILSPEAELFPRLAIFEVNREFFGFADDKPTGEQTEFRFDIYARDNSLYAIQTALHKALTAIGLERLSQVQDDYLPEQQIFVKSVFYDHYNFNLED